LIVITLSDQAAERASKTNPQQSEMIKLALAEVFYSLFKF
jgi:hypothetical protein